MKLLNKLMIVALSLTFYPASSFAADRPRLILANRSLELCLLDAIKQKFKCYEEVEARLVDGTIYQQDDIENAYKGCDEQFKIRVAVCNFLLDPNL